MSKIKQYIENSVEKQVDKITNKISDIDNINMVGIDEHNVDEYLHMAKEEHENKMKTKFL